MTRPSTQPTTVYVLRFGVALALGVLGVLFSGGQAEAQDRGGPRVIELDEIRIEGRVQKPNAFYILNRSNIGYEIVDLRSTFVREIVRSVQEEPF